MDEAFRMQAASQAAASSFSEAPLGHRFVLRVPLAKATANRCAECSADIREHGRHEVTDEQLLLVLNAQDDGKASVILPGELAVGSYKAALAACRDSTSAVINCAGVRLHDFLPATRKAFDALRQECPPRLLDVEWEDSESFEILLDDVVSALAWAREQVAAGRLVLVNCAQGRSRSVRSQEMPQRTSLVSAPASPTPHDRTRAHRERWRSPTSSPSSSSRLTPRSVECRRAVR